MKSWLAQSRILRPAAFSSGTNASQIINHITSIKGGLSTYLEIGVEYGRTFEAVRAKVKIGVDPRFRFIKNPFTRKIKLFCMTSDEFFQRQHLEFVDIAFLDGFHSGSQTYRDFVNLLPFLSHESVVIIDDVLPSDSYSALPTPEEAYEARILNGVLNDYSWHGDVYNAIFAIISNFRSLRFATIVDIPNPVTVFWNFRHESLSSNDHKFFINPSSSDFLKSKTINTPVEFKAKKLIEIFDELKEYFQINRDAS
jgi:hypothetical protein